MHDLLIHTETQVQLLIFKTGQHTQATTLPNYFNFVFAHVKQNEVTYLEEILRILHYFFAFLQL